MRDSEFGQSLAVNPAHSDAMLASMEANHTEPLGVRLWREARERAIAELMARASRLLRSGFKREAAYYARAAQILRLSASREQAGSETLRAA